MGAPKWLLRVPHDPSSVPVLQGIGPLGPHLHWCQSDATTLCWLFLSIQVSHVFFRKSAKTWKFHEIRRFQTPSGGEWDKTNHHPTSGQRFFASQGDFRDLLSALQHDPIPLGVATQHYNILQTIKAQFMTIHRDRVGSLRPFHPGSAVIRQQ